MCTCIGFIQEPFLLFIFYFCGGGGSVQHKTFYLNNYRSFNVDFYQLLIVYKSTLYVVMAASRGSVINLSSKRGGWTGMTNYYS